MNRHRSTRLGLSLAILAILSIAATGVPHAGGPPAGLELQLVTAGLSMPLAVRDPGDGSGRIFIVEEAGRIRIYDLVTETLLTTPFLDISSQVTCCFESGLLGLAFHPNYAQNGQFFVNYTRDPGPGLDRTVIARYQVSPNPDIADASSEVVLLEIEQDFGNHNGGNILFGPDGYLYIGMGDGGSGGDPLNRAQNLGNLLGKMLRIDVDGTPPALPNDLCGLSPNAYGIPPDNPFAGGAGDCDEIWSYGLRNPWRFSFDRLTGDLFIGDVGQGAIEEIDFQSAVSTGGENYGWSCMEGNSVAGFNPCDGAPLTGPIFEYNHGLGCSVTGGYRYRGPIASLAGTYIMGDYCSGRIWFGERVGATWQFSVWQDTTISISSFGEDAVGNVYVTDLSGGRVYRFGLSNANGAGKIPDGSQATTPLILTETAGTAIDLSWGASCLSADTDYEVYEGVLPNFNTHRPRLCSTGGATTATIQPGTGSRYYLVVPRNAEFEGSYGIQSPGLERAPGSLSCLDQSVADCP